MNNFWFILLMVGLFFALEAITSRKVWDFLSNLRYDADGNRRFRMRFKHWLAIYSIPALITFTHAYAKYPQYPADGKAYSPAATTIAAVVCGATWPLYGLIHLSGVIWTETPRK